MHSGLWILVYWALLGRSWPLHQTDVTVENLCRGNSSSPERSKMNDDSYIDRLRRTKAEAMKPAETKLRESAERWVKDYATMPMLERIVEATTEKDPLATLHFCVTGA